MSETKDYSLLRPFDPEAAKRGELLCGSGNQNIYELCAIGTQKPTGESIAVRVVDDGWLYLCRPEDLRMAPLCWVEGRPVYRGDVLRLKAFPNIEHVVSHVEGNKVFCNDGGFDYAADLTWTPPKVKREVKLYAWLTETALVRLRDGAHVSPGWIRVPSKDDVIEVEEPAEVAK